MIITLSPIGINNFHNSTDLRVRVNENKTINSYTREDGIVYRISKRQARRIENHFCGVVGCGCPKGGVVVQLTPEGDEFGLEL